jgi:TolB-like protein/cytochrome c-type biogenesis protein CcmH/NrfG
MSSPSSSTSDGLPRRAIFLSYAREDAPAAQRITDALRSQGLEIWFDQSELRGGDAWDQKIRRQIKDCALFMPIVSERTQGRGEGYFRLEWKLAVERTHLMAEGVPFLAPVVVDDTSEGEALVPAEFLRVQWCRLPSALPTPQFVAQIQKMVEAPGRSAAPARPTASTQELPRSRNLLWAMCALGAVGIAIAGTLFLSRRPQPQPVASIPIEAAAPAVDAKSIAVLPFDNMSEDKANEFFTDGVHEDVLTNLSYIKDLHVVSRTSVMQYRGTTKSIKTIGQELGVAYVLEGSVRREGNKVRVTGQLIDARTDEHVWAKAYDRDLNDIFAIQGELAQAIADALQAVLDPETKVLLSRRPTENTLAYDEYMKAIQLHNDILFGMRPKITALLESAVQRDPNFAQAWAELGSNEAFTYFNGEVTDQQLQRAKDAIDHAVRLAPDDPAVIEGLGDYYYYAYRDYARATEQYMRLQQMRPNDATVYFSLGLIQRREGRFVDSLPNLRKATELDPANHIMVGNYTDTLVALRRYDEAIRILRKKCDEEPQNLEMAWLLSQDLYLQNGSTEAMKAFAARKVDADALPAFYYAQKGNASTSCDWAEFERLDGIQPHFGGSAQDPSYRQDVEAARVLAEMGNMDAAKTRAAVALATMKPMVAGEPNNPKLWVNIGCADALLGNRDEALAALKKSEELMPESRDALTAPLFEYDEVFALAYLGEKDRALALLDHLFRVPNGANIYATRGTLRLLHDDPRFQAMVADPANNAPLNRG